MENPYAAPVDESAVTGFGISSDGADHKEARVAGKGLRFVNYVIDYIAVYALAIGLVMVCDTVLGSVVDDQEQMEFIVGLGAVSIFVLYYPVMEGATGKTIGKMLTGTRVVNNMGQPPSIGQVIGRSLARIIPFEPFSVLFSDPPRGWHDSLAGTWVVKG